MVSTWIIRQRFGNLYKYQSNERSTYNIASIRKHSLWYETKSSILCHRRLTSIQREVHKIQLGFNHISRQSQEKFLFATRVSRTMKNHVGLDMRILLCGWAVMGEFPPSTSHHHARLLERDGRHWASCCLLKALKLKLDLSTDVTGQGASTKGRKMWPHPRRKE